MLVDESDEFKHDRKIVMKTVTEKVRVLMYASNELIRKEDYCIAAKVLICRDAAELTLFETYKLCYVYIVCPIN